MKRDFFVWTAKPRLSYGRDDALMQLFVGPDKTSLDHVSDINLSVAQLVQSFDRFLMYHFAINQELVHKVWHSRFGHLNVTRLTLFF